jgi:hypothetical protein
MRDGGTACSRKVEDVCSAAGVTATTTAAAERYYSTTTKVPYIPACRCPGTLQ